MTMLHVVVDKLTTKDLPRFAKSITDNYTTGQRCAVDMCYDIGYAWEIWHRRDDDEGFWDWLKKETPREISSSRTARRYLQIYRNVLAHGTSRIENVPITKLRELAKTNGGSNEKGYAEPALPKRKREAILKKLASDKPPSTAEIKEEVRKALPPKVVPINPKNRFLWPVFAIRLANGRGDMTPERAAYLFALDRQAPPEDIKIIAKHWKQKYHPDKGGSKEEFDTICRAEEVFTAWQKEKEART